ncbi:MAG: alpha-L-fucosidase [Saprospiraceae bacterium]|nr:alpha-L-fucosidase [Saprospiraceae bacterium]
MRKISVFSWVAIGMFINSCTNIEPPDPVGPLPSANQLNWHQMEYYAFVHFNMNTFTDMEWGTGGEPPDTFNPTQLDTRQWTRIVKEAGMKGIILTAKHHDGFCLWPTETTDHSVKSSKWKNGNGDVVKELAEACNEFGLKMGLYLSPWDRNHPDYGRPEYVDVFHQQLRELLSNYGDVFEVWFDGANGGSGYYGGANEVRKIDNKTYYQWDKVHEIVNELQPGAVIFGDGGPGVRWVGNEEGWANETNWSLIRKAEVYPGWPKYVELRSGHEDGTHWVPAEADVSIRPGWYYHPREDHQVKTLPHLLDIYYKSIGRNASLLLNLPVDHRGLIHERDEEQLIKLKDQLREDFKDDLALGQKINTSNIRGNHRKFKADNLIDANPETYWATDDTISAASITVTFNEPHKFNRILLQEYIALGQRVQKFSIEAMVGGKWMVIDDQTTIGYKRILRFNEVNAEAVKVNINKSKGPVALSGLSIYRALPLLVEPTITRNKNGKVTLAVPDSSIQIYYSLNNNLPGIQDELYGQPLLIDRPVALMAIAYDPEADKWSEVSSRNFDVSKRRWKVIEVSSGDIEKAEAAIDDDPNTHWSTGQNETLPQYIIVDLGETLQLSGVSYIPNQDRWTHGIITDYSFRVSKNGNDWMTVVKGEFSNIANSRTEKTANFKPISGRFIRFEASKTHGDDRRASIGEISIISSR